jgi:predicted dehydrogenase
MSDKPLRVGLVGLDMSHAVEFARRLNDPADPEHVPGARVVAGWPGGSADFRLSWSRVEKFTDELRQNYGVAMVDWPVAVAECADVVLITAADGRAHRPLFERVLPLRRPTFIEKPLATSLADAQAIFHQAAEASIPVMSCSTIRFAEPLRRALAEDLGAVIGCDVFGPMPEEEPTQPGLFWYGVHCVEVLNVVMGRGCRRVQAYRTDDTDLLTAVWADGRVATFRGLRRGEWKFGVTLHREKGFQFVDLLHNSWFVPTLQRALEQLPRRRSPVDPADTLDIVRLIEAANESRPTGRPVQLSSASQRACTTSASSAAIT